MRRCRSLWPRAAGHDCGNHPEARTEFLEAAHWYEERILFAGDLFLKAVRHATDAILADPLRYQPVGDDIRVFRLKKFLFRLYYIAEEGTGAVCVYAIMHEKRRPDYWRHRVTG